MTDAIQRLVAALSDRYRIERELGAGGMATVYLAEDLRHDRKVAPDGRFLMLRPVLGERIDVRVALNWIDDIRVRLARAQ